MIFADFHLPRTFFPTSFSSFSLWHSLKNRIAYFSVHTVSRYMCYVRTHSSYVHTRRKSIIIDSKSRLKHRNAVACLYKIPKNTIPYHGLCCWMTLVTVRWLFVGSFSFRFLSRCSIPRREKSFIPDRTRLPVNSRRVTLTGFSFF